MNFVVKLWHNHLDISGNVCCLMINHSKYQDMWVCQKTTNLFIICACGLVHARLSFVSYNTCSRNISGVCLGLWFVSKKIEARLHLFNLLGNINFCKRGSINGILNFFCMILFISYISAHFTEPLLSENVLEISLPITSWISKRFYD